VPVSALRSIADFHLGGDCRGGWAQNAGGAHLTVCGQRAAECHWPGNPSEFWTRFQTLDPFGAMRRRHARATIPIPSLDLGLRQVAMLIKAEVGLEVAAHRCGRLGTRQLCAGRQRRPDGGGLLADLGARGFGPRSMPIYSTLPTG